jgi:biofilm protein TabA
MIIDRLSAASVYESLHPLFPQAFAWLRAFDPDTPDGKYPLVGEDLVAGVQRYRTAPAAAKQWEAHRVYGDIQFVCRGIEACGHADLRTLEMSQPYLPEKDVEKFAAPSGFSSLVILGGGNFAVFYPQDGHQPGVQIGSPAEVLKVVVKFRLG